MDSTGQGRAWTERSVRTPPFHRRLAASEKGRGRSAGGNAAVAALALGEGADIFLPTLGYENLVQPILRILLIGFPVATAAAWIFQVTPEGLLRDDVAAEIAQRADRLVGHSVAVLPFTDMSAANDQEYFADGMAEGTWRHTTST